MSVDRLYKDGDIVWVKLGNNWWPAEVTDGNRQPDGFLSQVKYEPYCVVKFFEEDTYEIVKSSKQIYPFKCNKKEEFIKKGLASFNANNDFMKKFPSDVEIAERSTRRVVESDLLVINDRPFSILKAIIGQKLTGIRNDNYENDIQTSSAEKRRSGDSVTKILNITPNRTNSSANNSSTGSSSAYRCNFCDFTSLRQNVMILHNKTHSGGSNIIATTTAKANHKVMNNNSTPIPNQTKQSGIVKKQENLNYKHVSPKPINAAKVTKSSASVNSNTSHTQKIQKAKLTAPSETDFTGAKDSNRPENKITTADNENKSPTSDFLPLRKSLRSSPKEVVEKVLVSSKIMAIEAKTTQTTKERIFNKSIQPTTAENNLLQDIAEDKEKEKNIQCLSSRKSEGEDSKQRPEDIMRSLQADWSDEEEVITSLETLKTNTPDASAKRGNDAFLVNCPKPASDIITTAMPVVASTSSVNLLPTSCGRIRNIPKKDRRDIILKEFSPNENYNSQSSTSTSTPPVVTVEGSSSRSSSNSSESIAVLDDGMPVINTSLESTDQDAAPVLTNSGDIESNELFEANASVSLSITDEQSIQKNSTILSDVAECNALKAIVPPISLQQPASPAAPTWSCFDFEEENDTDVLTSIAIFKKKHLSPDKNSTPSSEDSAITKHDEKLTATQNEQAFEIECKNKQLSAEIDSLLAQTKKTVVEITAVASANQEDVSVKALPIKERGKRIFKSRNRSRVEEPPSAASESLKILVPATESEEKLVEEEKSTLPQQMETTNGIKPEEKEASIEVIPPMVIVAPNEKEVEIEVIKNKEKADPKVCNFEENNEKEEMQKTQSNYKNLQSEQETEQESFALGKPEASTVAENDLESITVQDCETRLSDYDETIPLIKHAPVEIYKEDTATENETEVKHLSDNNIEIVDSEKVQNEERFLSNIDGVDVLKELQTNEDPKHKVVEVDLSYLDNFDAEEGYMFKQKIPDHNAEHQTENKQEEGNSLNDIEDIGSTIIPNSGSEKRPVVLENFQVKDVSIPTMKTSVQSVLENLRGIAASQHEKADTGPPVLKNLQAEEDQKAEEVACALENLHSEEDSLHETKIYESSSGIPLSTRNNDTDIEGVSRLTSPTDENSSIGISEAGAEFGSPTSMLDDERLPTNTGNLIREIERSLDNINEVNEAEITGKNIESCESSFTKEIASDKIEPVKESIIEVKEINETSENIGKPSQEEDDAFKKHLEMQIISSMELDSGYQAGTGIQTKAPPTSEKPSNFTTPCVSELTEEEFNALEEDDEIESPPHEQLSGNEMENEEEKYEIKEHNYKTKVKDKVQKAESYGQEKVLQSECKTTTAKEIFDGKINDIKTECEIAVEIKPTENSNKNSEVSGRVSETKNTTKAKRHKMHLKRKTNRTSTDSDDETSLTKRNHVHSLIDEEPSSENNSNCGDIKLILQNENIMSEVKQELSTPTTAGEQTDVAPHEVKNLNESEKLNELGSESTTRKRRSHIKITPRKRTATETSSISNTDVESPNCQAEHNSKSMSESTVDTSRSDPILTESSVNQRADEYHSEEKFKNLSTVPTASNTLTEMRSFRPRRKTNNMEACFDAYQSNQKVPEDVAKEIKTSVLDGSNAGMDDRTRSPSPIEKVRINVDVANPLSSQIANILATSGQQQRLGGNFVVDSNSPNANKVHNVSNLPATTSISKSSNPLMKRKKSIEDDIPSFIIERPCMLTGTSAEKEAFAHVKNKCPQVKITRKEKIIDQELGEELNQTLVSSAIAKGQDTDHTSSSSLHSPSKMFIMNPSPANQQKLLANDDSECVPSTLFDIGNMPILLANEQLISEDVHIVISPTTNAGSLPEGEITAMEVKQTHTKESKVEEQPVKSGEAQPPLLMHVLSANHPGGNSDSIKQQIVLQATTLESQEQRQLQNRPCNTSTDLRTNRLPIRQQSFQRNQDQQIVEEELQKNRKFEQRQQQHQKLTAHQIQEQKQQQQQISVEQKSQTCNQSNKQIGVDTRGNKYVIIKTTPNDLMVQQQLQQQEHTPIQQVQHHSAVSSQPKAQSGSFDTGEGITVHPGVDHQLPVSAVEASMTQESVFAEQQQQKQKSPAAAATGGRKHAGNTITLPSSITVKQQYFTDSLQSAARAVSPPGNGTLNALAFTPSIAQQKPSKYTCSGTNNKVQNRSGCNRRSKTQQQTNLPRQEVATNRKLLTKKDQKTNSSTSSTTSHRRLSSVESTLPTKVTKTGASNSFTGDVVIAQQQHSSQPPPLHHLQSRKSKKQHQRRSSSQNLLNAPNLNSGASIGPSELQLHAGCSNQQQQQSIHSTNISEEQLMQIQSEDVLPTDGPPATSGSAGRKGRQQIDGTSKILAVPTQPIPGYNETFLLCTLVNNNYKPIDNVPLYLDHDLNQLVPVPLEALDGQPNLIVNHPAPEEIVNQLQTPAPIQHRSNCNTGTASGSLDTGISKSSCVDSSSHRMICLEPAAIEENEASPTSNEVARMALDSMDNTTAVASDDADEEHMSVYMPPECGAELPSDNAVILNIEGQQIILDAATFAHLLANPDANTQLITDDGTEFVLTREVLAALEAQQDTQEEAAVEQQHQLEQRMQQAHHITEAGPTDILAVALAGTDLYGSEVLEIETSQGLQLVGADGIVFQTAPLTHAHLTPPITAQTSETNALLNQTPIMSTLEKPSTSGKRKLQDSSALDLFAAAVVSGDLPTCRPNLDDSLAVIGVTAQSSSTVPTSLELPITVTNPAIAPKSTMAGPTAPVGLSSTSTIAVTEAVQFQCLPHRTSLAGNNLAEDINEDDVDFGEDYFFNRAIN